MRLDMKFDNFDVCQILKHIDDVGPGMSLRADLAFRDNNGQRVTSLLSNDFL